MILKQSVIILYLILSAVLSFTPCTVQASSELTGSVSGFLLDQETGEPVAHGYIHLEEINRHTYSDRTGFFSLSNLPAGRYTLKIHRLGYSTLTKGLNITGSEELELELYLTPSILQGSTIEVIALSDGFTGSNIEHASTKLSGAALRRSLGATLAETLSNQPGFDMRTMGAAPARPVIRGLGDERVLILQDGERTGDFSASSPDHAVTIDPAGADEIQIARGPAALLYGSNAIGGVINMVRNQIATSVPANLNGTVTLQSASVNSGTSLGGSLSIPMKRNVLNLHVNGRYGRDFSTPDGTISNSGYLTSTNAAGYTLIRPWGYSGFSVSGYLSNYGIPPDPLGGHPDGVDIEMRKIQIENRNEMIRENGFLKLLESRLSYRYYNHKEFETAEIIGTEFTRNTVNLSLKAHHESLAFFNDGVIGFWGEFNDTFIYDRFNIETNGISSALFSVQEADFGNLHLELGIRAEANSEIPKQNKPNSRIGNIRQRNFFGIASSGSLIYHFGGGFYLGTVLMHSYRPPTANELYSEGPHIAAYAFEIGNPDLDPERGLGKELFLRYKTSDVHFEFSAYHNHFSNYIYPVDTGRENLFFPSLNDFQFESTRALLYGIEGQAEFHLLRRLIASASASYTIGTKNHDESDHGTLSATSKEERYLPMIPPLRLTSGLTYAEGSFSIGGIYRYSASQRRTALFEEPTDAYHLIHIQAQYRITTQRNLLHTFSLNIQNLTNTRYRNHLSRLKEVFPEPGRSFNLLYRLYF